MSLRRILIANRGEIAARIIRTCRDVGLDAVLAASEADMESVPARMADDVICIGPARPAESYLNPRAIVSAAKAMKADAVHPGYGFLSENVMLAEECEKAGIVFIGPTVRQLAAVGDKIRAREKAEAAKVPIVPGGSIDNADEAKTLAEKIGYPILIKAVGGGGGRGMKLVRELRRERPFGRDPLRHGCGLRRAAAGTGRQVRRSGSRPTKRAYASLVHCPSP